MWLEKGAFEALSLGYLEKCIMIMSSDEAGQDILEAWSLSVAWRTDEQGNAIPTIACGSQRSERSLRLKAPPTASNGKYTMEYARATSRAMLRQLSLLLQTMPSLPELHFLSLRVLYRDDVTPPDYEPEGFERAGDDCKMRFHSKVRGAPAHPPRRTASALHSATPRRRPSARANRDRAAPNVIARLRAPSAPRSR